MPPKKTYIFHHFNDEDIVISIDAYSFTHAMEKLVEMTKHPANYKCINV